MQQAAIYVREPLTNHPDILSKEDQEASPSQPRSGTPPGNRDEFTRMISLATRDDSPLDFIVAWKLHLFSISLEETIKLRDNLRRVDTRLVSATEKGTDD